LEVTSLQGVFLIKIFFLGTESLDDRLKKGFHDFESIWEDPENLEIDLKQLSKELLNNALKRDPMTIYLVKIENLYLYNIWCCAIASQFL
jgi:hypothetical protein